MAKIPSTANLMKKTYCLGDKLQCARYQIVSKGVEAPLDLYPNQTDRVAGILTGKR